MNSMIHTADVLASQRAAALTRESEIIRAQRERGDLSPRPRRGFAVLHVLRTPARGFASAQ